MSHDNNHYPPPGTPPSIGRKIGHPRAPPSALQQRGTTRAPEDEDGDHPLPAIRSSNYPEQNSTPTPLPISPSHVTAPPAAMSAAGRRPEGETTIYGSRITTRVNLEDDDPAVEGDAISWAPGIPSATAGGSNSLGTTSGRLPILPTAPTYRTIAPSPDYQPHNSESRREPLPVLNPNPTSDRLSPNNGDGMTRGHSRSNGIENPGHDRAGISIYNNEAKNPNVRNDGSNGRTGERLASLRTTRPGSKWNSEHRSHPNQALAKTPRMMYRPEIPPYRQRQPATVEKPVPSPSPVAVMPNTSAADGTAAAHQSQPPPRAFMKRVVSNNEDDYEAAVRRFGRYSEGITKTPLAKQNANILMSAQDLDDARSIARQLASLNQSSHVDTAQMHNVLELCKSTQVKVKRALEDESNVVDLQELIEVNDDLLYAIAAATNRIDKQGVGDTSLGSDMLPSHNSLTSSISPNTPSMLSTSPSRRESSGMIVDIKDRPSPMSIDVLVRKEDIFSLILMLKAPQEKRLDSALALMRFARQAERDRDSRSMRLRNDIRSSGGINALLALFQTKDTTREVRVVAALAVAYLLPSLVESSTTSTPILALRIVECLGFLFSSQPVSPRSEEIPKVEMYTASIMGLTTYLSSFPMLQLADTALETRRARGRQRGALDHRPETLDRQKLLEITVALIVNMAKLGDADMLIGIPGDSELALRYTSTLVEQVCAVDAARPLAVREGLIQVLVQWVKSKDPEKVRPAATSLRDLTSTSDKYMAGWIHSQTVSGGFLGEIVKLVECTEYGHDVRLAVAQILSSLCSAPHTRDAVVEAQCITYLISLLWCDDSLDPSSKQVAYAAGCALLQLAAGAMTRAGYYDADAGERNDALTMDQSNQVIDDIVNGGAIDILVKLASSEERGKLRSMSIEALRVLSEDTSPRRLTRLQLCEHQAATALGNVLQDNVGVVRGFLEHGRELTVSNLSEMPSNVIQELHQALCALANMLDPTEAIAGQVSQKHTSMLTDAAQLLIRGCIQISSSGGIRSLLTIASLPVTIESFAASSQDVDAMDLLIEACRSLAALSPLLLSEEAAKYGYTAWTCQVLQAFTVILRRLSVSGEGKDTAIPIIVHELMNDVLRGLSALAQSEPLKIRIVDRALPYLMKTKAGTGLGDRSEVANTAGQVCLSLGFAEDELAIQGARNDPNLLGDWFCLRRSLLIQAMAREELRVVLAHTWQEAVAEAKKKGKLRPPPEREVSRHSSSSGGDHVIIDYVGERGVDEFFWNVGKDEDSSILRASVLNQYENLFERGTSIREDPHFPVIGADSDGKGEQPGLLCRQVYPLRSAEEENDWILGHQRALKDGASKIESDFRDIQSSRVRKLLDSCIPSRLLQKEVLPVFEIRPETSFDFRALVMPQRKYFSFVREGQLVQRVCEEMADGLESDDVHWTLGFTNSSFAGEFAETLVQAMYKCPMIRGLSFARSADKESDPDEESGQLANLAGSLPPCVTDLTFDNVLNDRSVSSLISILETIGRLSAGQQRTEATEYSSAADSVIQKQGSFRLLGIRNSPHLKRKVMLSFFHLLGGTSAPGSGPTVWPLACLLCLDLSGNDLDDAACSVILKIVHSKESHCRLEQLDLSRNIIRKGGHVVDVLRSYINKHRFNENAGVKMKKGWRSSLHTLNLASNQLSDGELALKLIDMMNNDALSLKSLDLSFNDLKFEGYPFVAVMGGTLSRNSTLQELNLSGNNFDCETIDSLVERLRQTESESGLTFLRFDSNTPPITDFQLAALDEFERRSRTLALDRFLSTEVRTQPFETSHDPVIHERNHSIRHVNWGEDDTLSLFSDDGLSRADSVQPRTGENEITVLFSAPLVFRNDEEKLCPFEKLDFAMERDLLWACLKEASRDIKLSFDNATKSRLLAAKAMRPSCLHYSGHGHKEFLLLESENGTGGVQGLTVGVLKDLITQEGGAPFKFVFVSACFSLLAGETFASAGVPHVVCCEEEAELKDAAALAFTKQFYLSLAVGNTVRESFEQGCLAVGATANLRSADLEMRKFVLLPRDGNHDVPVFSARRIREWPRAKPTKTVRERNLIRSRSSFLGGARNFELSVRNMMQEDPSPTPPQFFLGREVDMFKVLSYVLTNRFVIVTGEPGVGRSSLVCAICHYINERKSTIMNVNQIFHVKMKEEGRGGDRCRLLIKALLIKLVEARTVPLPAEIDQMGVEDLSKVICKALKTTKALIVFDHTELLENNDEAKDFPLFLRTLFEETRHVRVLLTDRKPFSIPSIGGVIKEHYTLRGLTFSNSVRLFAKACCHLHTGADRVQFFERMIIDDQQADLISGDSNCTERTKRLFKIIGDGMPGLVEKSASAISADEVRNLGRDD